MSSLRKVYFLSVVVLAGLLATQIGLRLARKPEPFVSAIWKHRPKSIAAARNLSNLVVTGKVVKIERGEDFVVEAPGEPDNEIRIPVEVVTIEVTKTHKGRGRRRKEGEGAKVKELVQVFHTGHSQGAQLLDRPEPPASERPPKPPGGIERPDRVEKPSPEEARRFLLHDDPAYKVGESYVLFLMDGPKVRVDGKSFSTKSVTSPEGRYRVVKNKIEPVTTLGFADKLRGRSLEQFETMLGK